MMTMRFICPGIHIISYNPGKYLAGYACCFSCDIQQAIVMLCVRCGPFKISGKVHPFSKILFHYLKLKVNFKNEYY